MPCETLASDLYHAGVWHVNVHACISPCVCTSEQISPFSVFNFLVKAVKRNTEMNTSHFEHAPLVLHNIGSKSLFMLC